MAATPATNTPNSIQNPQILCLTSYILTKKSFLELKLNVKNVGENLSRAVSGLVDTIIVAGEGDQRHRVMQILGGIRRFVDQLLEEVDLSAHVRAHYKGIENAGATVREIHPVFQLP